MPTLTRLAFGLNTTTTRTISDHLLFSYLHNITLYSTVLGPISWFLSHSRLPAVLGLTVYVDSYPAKLGLLSFFAGLQTSGVSDTIRVFRLTQSPSPFSGHHEHERRRLGLDELHPFTAFSELRRIKLDINWDVDLGDGELLTLVSAWPQLRAFNVNSTWGWATPGAIMPDGLRQLVQACPSLNRISLALDTRGYAELSPFVENAGLLSSRLWSINVVDSFIQKEVVSVMSTFFATIAPLSYSDGLFAWQSERMMKGWGSEVQWSLWQETFRKAACAVRRHY